MRIWIALLALGAGVIALYWQELSPLLTGDAVKRFDTLGDAPIFEDFTLDSLNQVNRMTVVSGQEEVVIDKTADEAKQNWMVVNYIDQLNYPADKTQIFSVLHAVLEAERVEQKTSKPELYSRLGVEDPAAGSGNVLLRLATGESQWALIVGRESQEHKQGQYVRRAKENASWLINRRFSLSLDKNDWLDKNIVDISNDAIQSMAIDNPRSSTGVFVLSRDDGAAVFKVKGFAEPPANVHRATQIAGIIEALSFKEVFPKGDDKHAAPKGKTITTRYTTFDGLVIEIQCFKTEDDETFFILKAEAMSSAAANVVEQAGRLNTLYTKWVYHVPENLFEAMDGALVDFAP